MESGPEEKNSSRPTTATTERNSSRMSRRTGVVVENNPNKDSWIAEKVCITVA
jgi:hypothetical protein